MIHATIFGGHDGLLQANKRFFLTLFAGCDLARPTVARQLLSAQEAKRTGSGPTPKPFFLTMFGGVDIRSPTLAEEFIDLREMINSGMLTMEDWERSMATLGRGEGSVASLTLFGGFDERALPSENQEVDALAIQRHLGNIPESATQVLQYGIGQNGSERTATVRRAIQAANSPVTA